MFDAKKVSEAISSGEIFWGMVTRIGRESDTSPYMEVTLPDLGCVGTVMAEEVDAEIERHSLVSMLGRKIPVIVLSMDDGRILCSRKQAQVAIKVSMAQDLASHTVLSGEVIREAPYGVYVEVNGISGLLKNSDYINVAVPVSDFLKVGNKVDVMCKNISTSGKIQWEPAEKPKAEDISYDVEEDTCVVGKVINLKPFDNGGVGVFVRISRGLDALCLLPPDMEISPDDQVSVKIVSVTPDPHGAAAPPRVKGKILRVL